MENSKYTKSNNASNLQVAVNRLYYETNENYFIKHDVIKSAVSNSSDLIWQYFDNNRLLPASGWTCVLLDYLYDAIGSDKYDMISSLFKGATVLSAILLDRIIWFDRYYNPLFDKTLVSDIWTLILEMKSFEYGNCETTHCHIASLISKMATMLVTLHLTNPYLTEEKMSKTQLDLFHRTSEHEEIECIRLLIKNIEEALLKYSSGMIKPIKNEKPQGVKEIERRIKSQYKMKDVMIMYYLMKQNKERGWII